uniref:Zinc transporter ZIP11 n=1 Tax=Strongyloides venezuelensis TaxID=75913 RepID=A0A0K0G2M3_STRVS
MLRELDPIPQSLVASFFTWGVTALGAALVFILPKNSKKFLDVSLGFAAGVMTAASFWSLLAPSIEISEQKFGKYACIPVSLGFAFGAFFVHIADRLLPSCLTTDNSVVKILTDKMGGHDSTLPLNGDINSKGIEENSNSSFIESKCDKSDLRRRKQSCRKQDPLEGVDKEAVRLAEQNYALSWRRILLLIMAVTVHNIPEGMAVGVAFGSIGKTHAATFESAFNLALGIGLQNFPEGLAVSLPLVGFGYSKYKAFLYGQMSGMVEPFAALFGAAAVIFMEPVLPYALSFAAGAMIFVVVDDIIPEAQQNGNGRLASIGTIVGFIVMMAMDVGLQ